MKPQELRIENKILRKKTNDEWVECTVNLTYLELIQKYPEDYKPIMLTGKRLLEFGFKKASYRVFYLGNFGVDLGIETYFIIKQGDAFTRIKMQPYVHRLQNIYFELTDKELTSIPIQ